MAAGAGLLGEGAEIFEVNPFAFPETAGHPGQNRVYNSGRIHQGEEELFGYHPGELGLGHLRLGFGFSCALIHWGISKKTALQPLNNKNPNNTINSNDPTISAIRAVHMSR